MVSPDLPVTWICVSLMPGKRWFFMVMNPVGSQSVKICLKQIHGKCGKWRLICVFTLKNARILGLVPWYWVKFNSKSPWKNPFPKGKYNLSTTIFSGAFAVKLRTVSLSFWPAPRQIMKVNHLFWWLPTRLAIADNSWRVGPVGVCVIFCCFFGGWATTQFYYIDLYIG